MEPWSLRFRAPDLEAEYRARTGPTHLRLSRVALWVGIAQWSLFGILDPVMMPDSFRTIFLIRYAIALPILFGFMALSYTRLGKSHLDVPVCLGILSASLALDGMVVFAGAFPEFLQAGTLILLVYLVAIVRVRVPYATVTVAVMLLGFLTALVAAGVDQRFLIFNTFVVVTFSVAGILARYQIERLTRRDFFQAKLLDEERAKSDQLLRNVLPDEVAAVLKAEGRAEALAFDEATVMFADIVGFTTLSAQVSPTELVAMLDETFSVFDGLSDRHGLEKIKTIGDSYMAVAGVPVPRDDHAAAVAEMALDMLEGCRQLRFATAEKFDLRIGIASGPVVAGVIGRRKFAYDLWGDTVNIASRMESQGTPGKIQVSERTRDLLSERYAFGLPNVVDVRGRGPMVTYYLLGSHAEVGAQVDSSLGSAITF